MFLPEQHSCFGLCHSQRSASIYQWISASLRMGSLAVWVLMVPNFHDEPMCASPLIPFEDDACGEMPSWLRPGCGTFFSPSKWQKCMSVSWAYGYCNLLAAQCRNQALGSVNLLISIFFSSSLSLISFLSPCLWLGGALYFHHTGTQIFNIPKALELETSIREEEILLAAGDPKAEQLGPWMIRYMWADLILSAVDLAFDVCCIFVFIFASNWFFALAQILILSTSLLRGKNYVSLLQDFKKTYTSGIFTEAYLDEIILERTRRAPLSLVLQLYASSFVTTDFLVASIFTVSLLSSFCSALLGGFLEIHLDLSMSSWSRV